MARVQFEATIIIILSVWLFFHHISTGDPPLRYLTRAQNSLDGYWLDIIKTIKILFCMDAAEIFALKLLNL
jgi:hypothetical protein